MLLGDRCTPCGRPGPSPCPSCAAGLPVPPPLAPPEPLVGLAALLAYDGGARPLVAGVKLRHARGCLGWLGAGMAALLPPGAQLVTWAPTTRARAARRGVDHARLLAEATAAAAGVRAHRTLRRLPGRPQTGRPRAERLADGPAFEPCFDLTGLVVVVVDDVATTGATLAAAGRALAAAGAAEVHGLVAAATPGRGSDAPRRRSRPRSVAPTPVP